TAVGAGDFSSQGPFPDLASKEATSYGHFSRHRFPKAGLGKQPGNGQGRLLARFAGGGGYLEQGRAPLAAQATASCKPAPDYSQFISVFLLLVNWHKLTKIREHGPDQEPLRARRWHSAPRTGRTRRTQGDDSHCAGASAGRPPNQERPDGRATRSRQDRSAQSNARGCRTFRYSHDAGGGSREPLTTFN